MTLRQKLWLFAAALLAVAAYYLAINWTDDNGMSRLMRAARDGDTAQVKRLILMQADVNDRVEGTPVRAILSVMGGFTPIPKRDVGWSPLTYAGANGHLETVRVLLDAGSNPTDPALFEVQDADILRVILARKPDLEIQGLYRATPLLWAVIRGNRAKTELLIGHGARVNVVDWNGLTPLHFAARRNDPELVRMLVKAGASLTARDNRAAQTPLMWAAQERHEAAAAALREAAGSAGTTSAASDDGAGRRSLHQAVETRNLVGVQAALAMGVPADARDGTGHTPLVKAINLGQVEIVRALLAARAQVNEPDDIKKTPIYWAAQKRNPELVRVLLEAGANVRGPNAAALSVAAQMGDMESVKLLLAAGADVNTGKGSPLRGAAWRGQCGIVELLLKSGANPNLDDDGMTALMRASGLGHAECVRMLLAAGANPNAVDKGANDYSALRAARSSKHDEVIRLLEAAGAKK